MTDAPVIEAIDLHRSFPVSRGWLRRPALLRALDGVSFRLPAGRTLAVVGESGCGKSTLARCVALIDRPDAGRVLYGGRDPRGERSLRRQVQMVFQNPHTSLNPRRTIGETLMEPLAINTALSATARRAAALDMLARVGLEPGHADRYPHMFSGGQRQRVAIARALMLNPQAVAADEPVSALDVSVQAQTLNLLMDLQAELGVAYLFISHDLSVVRHVADEVMVMYLGRVVEQGPRAAIFAAPRHPYTRLLLAAAPRLNRQNAPPAAAVAGAVLAGEPPSPLDPPMGCAFYGRCPLATLRCRDEKPALTALDGGLVACHHGDR